MISGTTASIVTIQVTFVRIAKIVTLNKSSASRSGFAVMLVDVSQKFTYL